MGEAKRRGSREQRVTAARGRNEAALSHMAEWVNLPVDEELYLFCSNLYSAAAHMSMPVDNPASRKIGIEGFGTFAFSDIPVNRGMLAVTKELEEQGIAQPTRFSMCWRVMHFGDVLAERERFAKWIRPGEEPDAVSVAEALIRACAIARIDLSDDKGSFDMDDVARHAAEIEARLDAEDGNANRESNRKKKGKARMEDYAIQVAEWLERRVRSAEDRDPMLAGLKQKVRETTAAVNAADEDSLPAALHAQEEAIQALVKHRPTR